MPPKNSDARLALWILFDVNSQNFLLLPTAVVLGGATRTAGADMERMQSRLKASFP